jgi:hypothetical protein
MARSTCVKCDGTTFEVAEVLPLGSSYCLLAIQCTACGGVVGVTEKQNVAALITYLADALGKHLPH